MCIFSPAESKSCAEPLFCDDGNGSDGREDAAANGQEQVRAIKGEARSGRESMRSEHTLDQTEGASDEEKNKDGQA